MAIRDDLVQIIRHANQMLIILDLATVTEVLLDTTGRDLEQDTVVVLTAAQRNAIQAKFVTKRTAIKTITAAWP